MIKAEHYPIEILCRFGKVRGKNLIDYKDVQVDPVEVVQSVNNEICEALKSIELEFHLEIVVNMNIDVAWIEILKIDGTKVSPSNETAHFLKLFTKKSFLIEIPFLKPEEIREEFLKVLEIFCEKQDNLLKDKKAKLDKQQASIHKLSLSFNKMFISLLS